MRKKLVSILLCATLLAGCGKAGTVTIPTEPNPAEPVTKTVVQELEPVQKENTFDKAAYFLDMVAQCASKENTIVSPLSLNMALGLAAEGAKGDTAKEIEAYLGKDDYGTWAKAYIEEYEKRNEQYKNWASDGYKVVLELANSVWVDKNKNLVKEYVTGAKNHFHAEVDKLDFHGKKEKAVNTINDWCDKKTHGLIPGIITEDSITADTSAILVNSLYFEAPWAEEWYVSEGEFTDIDGKKSKQDMLRDTGKIYYENEYATAFSKSYFGGLQFIGILPKVEGKFTVTDLDILSLLQSKTTKYDVHMQMPKLNFDTTAENIISILNAQGMQAAFDPLRADFSGLMEMTEDEVTYISDIIQKCKIELDENGTKAAAVTAIMAKNCAVSIEEPRPEKYVYLDRPFAFLIYDEANEEILFIGKVVNPK